MPSTVAGVVIFGMLLAPGLCYSAARRLAYPERDKSPLRETAGTVFVSLLCLLASLALCGGVRTLWPHVTPDVGRFVQAPGGYFQGHYLEVALWAVGFVLLASLVAAALAWYTPSPQRPHFNSAWRELFVCGWFKAFEEDEPNWVSRHRSHDGPGTVFVGCELADGTHLSGVLNSYSTESDETSDREVTLVPPILYRPKGCDRALPLEHAGMVSVSARHIKFVTATYYPRDHQFSITVDELAKGEA